LSTYKYMEEDVHWSWRWLVQFMEESILNG